MTSDCTTHTIETMVLFISIYNVKDKFHSFIVNVHNHCITFNLNIDIWGGLCMDGRFMHDGRL